MIHEYNEDYMLRNDDGAGVHGLWQRETNSSMSSSINIITIRYEGYSLK
jgi:hypothetical protein